MTAEAPGRPCPEGTRRRVASSMAFPVPPLGANLRNAADHRPQEADGEGLPVGGQLEDHRVRRRHGPGLDPAAALDDLLRAGGAVGGGEGRAHAGAQARGLGAQDARVAPQDRLDAQQQRELVLQGDGEGVARAGGVPVAAGGPMGASGRPVPAGSASARDSARARAASIPAFDTSAVAAKPHAPPTRTRTPTPSVTCASTRPTRPSRTRTRSSRPPTWRASA
jgi:hypothetical protein